MFYVECDESNLNMASGAVTDISGKCGRHATPAQCNRVPFVRKRCQKSCKVCVGGKFERNWRLLMIFLFNIVQKLMSRNAYLFYNVL